MRLSTGFAQGIADAFRLHDTFDEFAERVCAEQRMAYLATDNDTLYNIWIVLTAAFNSEP